jgi:hypothetical protein
MIDAKNDKGIRLKPIDNDIWQSRHNHFTSSRKHSFTTHLRNRLQQFCDLLNSSAYALCSFRIS